MIDAITDFFVSKLVGEIYQLAREQLEGNLTSERDDLLIRLNSIEEKADMQLLAPLKAGLTFLRLHKLDSAIDELVRAEATDGDAAVAKFWLGVALIMNGQEAAALQFLRSSVVLNPFLSGSLMLPSSQSTSPEHPPFQKTTFHVWKTALLGVP